MRVQWVASSSCQVMWKISAAAANPDRRPSATQPSGALKAVRRNSLPFIGSSNCWCSVMSQPLSFRTVVTACTMPGCSGQLRVRTKDPVMAGSALDDVQGDVVRGDDVESETTAGGFLVFDAHVGAGLPHGLDRLVQRHVVLPVAGDGHPGRGDGLDGGHRVAFDAGDLHEPTD